MGMKIVLSYINLDSTPSLETFVQRKVGTLSRLLKRFDAHDEAELKIELKRTTRHHHKGPVFETAANLVLPRKSFRAVHQDTDIRTCIDAVRDMLHVALERYKRTLEPKTTRAK